MSEMDKLGRNHDFLKQFRNSPLFIYSASYLSGILIAGSSPAGTEFSVIFTSSVIISALGIYHLNFNDPLAGRDKLLLKTQKILFITAFFSMGLLNIFLSGYGCKITKITSLPIGKIILLKVIVKEISTAGENGIRVIGYSREAGEGIMLFINGNNSGIESGDTLNIRYRPSEIKSGNNESRINLKLYYSKKGIYSSGYVNQSDCELIKAKHLTIRVFFSRLRDSFAMREKELLKNDDASGVIIGLTTGLKTYMRKEIKASFSKSGTMHLMAVSGLHVNFIYMILTSITLLMGNIKSMRYARAGIILAVIWLYAFFTGMAPSILRAVIMITMAEAGRVTGKDNNSLNALSFAVLAICIHNPASAFDAGFQLSFLATLSIIMLVKPLSSLYNPGNRIMKYLWNSACVSLCCQTGTLPLTIHYFGFFPLYFLLSNIVAIPLSSVIILFGIAQFSLSESFLSDDMASVAVWLCKVLIWFTGRIESLPLSVIEFR